MRIFIALALISSGLSLAQAGHGVVTPDILHHVSNVLSEGYGSKVTLGYPEKAYLVDYGHSIIETPYYGHYGGGGGYGHHHGGGYSHGHALGHHGHHYGHHYSVPAYLGYAGTAHGHYGY